MSQEFSLSGFALVSGEWAISCGVTYLAFEAFGKDPRAGLVVPIGLALLVPVQIAFLFLSALRGDVRSSLVIAVAALLALVSVLCEVIECRWIWGLPESVQHNSAGPLAAGLVLPLLLFGSALLIAAWGFGASARGRTPI